MSSVFGTLEQFVRELEVIKAKRQDRDSWVFGQMLLGAAKSLRDGYQKWSDEELNGLHKQYSILSQVIGDAHDAKLRLEKVNADLTRIEDEQLDEIKKRLESFIEKLESGEVGEPDELRANFTENLMPAVNLIFTLQKLRELLDAMGDMIPR